MKSAVWVRLRSSLRRPLRPLRTYTETMTSTPCTRWHVVRGGTTVLPRISDLISDTTSDLISDRSTYRPDGWKNRAMWKCVFFVM